MKKVWIINSVSWNSAISEYALNLSRSIKDDYEVTLSLLEGKAPSQRASNFDITCINFESFSLINLAVFKRIEKAIDPDIVICFSGAESFLARFLSKNRKLIRFKGRDDDVGKAIDGGFANRYIDHFLFPCELIASASLLVNSRFTKIFLGCDDKKFEPKENKIQDRPSLLILGRLDPVKGHTKFIDLFAEFLNISSLSPKPILKIIGKDANLKASDITDYAASKGLKLGEDIVVINDFLENIVDHIASSSIGVVSSLGSEVICRVSEEFLLCGVPVFVSNVGSLRECIFSKEAGTVFSYDNYKKSIKDLELLLQKSIEEDFETKKKRALEARNYFSFKAMNSSFNELVQAIF